MHVITYRRFSSDEQETGDSLTRQTRVCAQFAVQQGWTISETITDKGRSAYKNEHLEGGELGRFVARVEGGDFEPGTILVAEKLDRLSRRPVAEAMAWLYRLTLAGVRVAIVDKGKVFGSNMSLEDYLGATITLAQGNDESKKKSDRITSAKLRLWGMAERKEGAWTNLASKPPTWLSRTPDRNGWIVDEARAAVVRDIFQWSADGLGAVLIAARLNKAGIKPFGKWRKHDETWGRTAIRQLLVHPAPQGDYVGETGMFAGRVITGFYPRIVDAFVASRAGDQQRSRQKLAGKRVSTGSTNLFAGRTVCGQCGKPAYLTTSKSKGRSYRYLKCEGSAELRSCTNRSYYAYEAFEAVALDLCLDLALDDRFFQASGELRAARIREAELVKEIAEKTKARGRLLAVLEDGDDQVLGRMRELRAELATLEALRVETLAEIDRASGKVGAVEHLQRVQDIREAAESPDPTVSEQARSKLRQAMSAIVNSVAVEMIDGVKTFTLALLGGVMAVRFNDKGEIIRAISDAGGKPLSDYLSFEQRLTAEPLLRRIEARQAA